MTFHLEGPWLSTTGKKKGPKKWASSEAKAKAEALDQQWKDKLKKWGIKAEDKKRSRALSSPIMPVNSGPKIPPGRETPYIASRDTGWLPCTKKTDTIYTGTKCLGVSVLHKSNGIPVFSQDEVVEISKMRR
jgi:hypothetical protein